MRRLALLSAAFLTLVSAGIHFHTNAQPAQGRTFAFLVACGDYDKTQLKPVPELAAFHLVLIDSCQRLPQRVGQR